MSSKRQTHLDEDLKVPLLVPSTPDVKRLSTCSSTSSLTDFLSTPSGSRVLGTIAVLAVLVVGFGLGFSLPPNKELHPKSYARASSVVGWMYFACWSFSFYPQIYENWRRKSVHGLSFDFLVFNILGFGCYSIFNCALFWSEKMKTSYAKHHHGKSSPVEVNDVFFSLHALAASLITAVQCVLYERGGQRVSELCKLVTVVTVLGATGYGALTLIGKQLCDCLSVLSWLYLLSYVKLAVTVFKYMPQIYLNHVRKSTEGWSISNCLLDIAGGGMSLTQMFADAYVKADYSAITGDPVKFGLGFVSMIADVIIMVQHYILFPDYGKSGRRGRRAADASTRSLGGDEEDGCSGPGCVAAGAFVDQGGVDDRVEEDGSSSDDDDDAGLGHGKAPRFKAPSQHAMALHGTTPATFLLPAGSYTFTTLSTPRSTPAQSLSLGPGSGALLRSADAEEQEAAARTALLPVPEGPPAPVRSSLSASPAPLSRVGSGRAGQAGPVVLSSRNNSGALVYVVVEGGAITLTSSAPSVMQASAGSVPIAASSGRACSGAGPVEDTGHWASSSTASSDTGSSADQVASH